MPIIANWLSVTGLMSAVAYLATVRVIPKMGQMFVNAHLYGVDLCKRDRTRKIPESQGIIAGSIYLIVLFCCIPIEFSKFHSSFNHLRLNDTGKVVLIVREPDLVNHHLFVQFLAGLLSICCMLFLGFADDVLNLRWRVKLLLPTIASLPLLIVYALTYDNTTIIVPKPFRAALGTASINLHLLYYVYLSMLAVFCTNAINILAGVNGLEVGQSLLIAISIIGYNVTELIRATDHWHSHIFSLNMMVPFGAVSLALLRYNWFPARIFVGDTYCYFAGMTFAVVGILGHFSKTMLLFFIPQVFNFLYSCPQLFHFLPCPRHRLPKYNPETDRLQPSTFSFRTKDLNVAGIWMLRTLQTFGLVQCRATGNDGQLHCSNLTLINLMLVWLGPMNEPRLTTLLLLVQLAGTALAFGIRYGLSEIFY